jgi:hypothetical protein
LKACIVRLFAIDSPFVVEDFSVIVFYFICALQLQRPPAVDVNQPKPERCPPLVRWPCSS